VLPGEDSRAYRSVRVRPVSRVKRFELGRRLRQKVSRSSLGVWRPADNRPDPIALIERVHVGRVASLIPIRIARMVSSPYGFLRGGANVMAQDLARLPATGITPVICGDAHLGNFGFYASPERDLVLDLNDFDEAHPGGWEWDLRRLVASIWVAGRHNGFSEDHCERSTRNAVRSYRETVATLATEPLLSRSFERLDVDRLHRTTENPMLREEIRRAADAARNRTSDRVLPKITSAVGGRRRIIESPPLVARVSDQEYEAIAEGLDDYLRTIGGHWGRVLGGYTIEDIAHLTMFLASPFASYISGALIPCDGGGAVESVKPMIESAGRMAADKPRA